MPAAPGDDPRAPGTTSAQRTAIHVLKRGVWENKGEPVGPRPPSVLVADDAPELPADVRRPAHPAGALARLARAIR